MATGKPPKPRRIRMPGMRSGSDDLNIGVGSLSLSLSRSDAAMDNPGDSALPPAFRNRLYELFNQIEREFEALYSENLQLQEKVDMLNGRPSGEVYRERERPSLDQTDFDSFFVRNLSKQKLAGGGSTSKMKPGHRLKAQTSRIVSSFKAPALLCSLSREFRGHRDGVWDITTSRIGLPIIGTASADGTACIWSAESGRCLLQYQGHKGSVNSIRFHPSKDLVLTASGDTTCHLWQAAISSDQLHLPQKGLSSEEEVELSEKEDNNGLDDDTLPLVSASLRTPICELTGHSNAVVAADWILGGDQAITASWDRTANVWDVATGELLHSLVGHDQELTHASAHPMQRLVVTSSKDTTFRLWDFRDPIHSVSVFQGHSEAVTCVTFSREDKVVSGSDDRTAKVWDLRNMRSPLAAIRCESPVNKLSISTSNIIAIPLDNRNVLLCDLSGQRLARLPRSNRTGHRRMVCSAVWGEENIYSRCNLFTGGFDRMAYGWSVQPNKEYKD